jgi:methionyl-tRNA synthetase
MQTFYLTTPIYYPNARPHVGSAYTTIVCDVIARYKRMCGYDVAFLTGTDEHGEKLARAAEAAGESPSAFVAEKRKLFEELWDKLGISEHRFVHTSGDPDHVRSVQWMLKKAQEGGYIDKRRYEGRYCIYDERYVSEGTEPANCDICGRPAELISEENYFFRLSAFQDRLLALYDEHPGFVRPDFRLNEVKSFVRSGLRDISVSRGRLKWGIPWPDDPEQVVYVWYDALTSYLTGIGFGSENQRDCARFEQYWRNDASGEVLHMIGKDILRFHAVYWPAFLMAAGLPLPRTVFAHGWIYYEQDKMSKSKGNVVYPEPIVEALDSFGAPGNDALRYYLLREAPFGQDTSFSYEKLIQRYNGDLANDLGNLASRTLTMIDRYFEGRVPDRPVAVTDFEETLKVKFFGGLTPKPEKGTAADWEDLRRIPGQVKFYDRTFALLKLSDNVLSVYGLIADLNKYLVERQPWKLAHDEGSRSELATVLYTTADLLRTITAMLYPIIPQSASLLWKQLGCEGELHDQPVRDLKWGQLEPGTKVGRPEPIFPRLDKSKALAKLEELAEIDRQRDQPKETSKPVESETPKTPATAESTNVATASAAAGQAVKQEETQSAEKITIDDFAKVEMRVGEVMAAEPIPGAKKLLKLQVDIGSEVRQVCAGIAEYYQPQDLIGMKVVLVTNLQPRKLRGIDSNGMILAASIGDQGKPVLATFKEDVPKGARLK